MVSVRAALLAEHLLGLGERDRRGAGLRRGGEHDPRGDRRVELVAAADAARALGDAGGRDLDLAADPSRSPASSRGSCSGPSDITTRSVERRARCAIEHALDQLGVVAGGLQLGLRRPPRRELPRGGARREREPASTASRPGAAAARRFGSGYPSQITTRPRRRKQRSPTRGLKADMQRSRYCAPVTSSDARHRELGLTDAEYELICEKLGREPNDVELAMFSLLWSEHCAYKHSRKLLRRLPTDGPAGADGAGRERRRGLGRRRLGGRVQGRVAQPPERGRAVPGRGHRGRRDPPRRVRPRRAADRGARLAALRRARLRALALPVRPRSSPGSAITATRSGSRRSAARSTSSRPTSRTASSTRCASASPARERDGPRRGRRGRQRGRADRAPRPGATGSAVPRCSPRPSSRSGDDSKRPTVQIGDPFEEAKLLECCLELLERGPAGLAAGPRGRRA